MASLNLIDNLNCDLVICSHSSFYLWHGQHQAFRSKSKMDKYFGLNPDLQWKSFLSVCSSIPDRAGLPKSYQSLRVQELNNNQKKKVIRILEGEELTANNIVDYILTVTVGRNWVERFSDNQREVVASGRNIARSSDSHSE